MVASKTSSEAASNDAVLDTSVDLVAELEEQQAEQAQAAVAPKDEVVLSRGTKLSTNTVYEDRTLNPEVERVVKYQLEEVQLGNGTVLTNVGAEIE